MVRASAVKSKCNKARATMQAEVNLVWRSHTHEAQAQRHEALALRRCCKRGYTLGGKEKKRQGSASSRDCTEMKGCSAKIFCITVLYVAGEERLLKYPCILGIYNVSGQSTLQPAIVHFCPNETVIFTCYGRQAMNMEWIMKPYVLEEGAKSFVAALAVNNRHIFTFTYTDFISSKLTNLTGYENRTADMTVTLTIQPIE